MILETKNRGKKERMQEKLYQDSLTSTTTHHISTLGLPNLYFLENIVFLPHIALIINSRLLSLEKLRGTEFATKMQPRRIAQSFSRARHST